MATGKSIKISAPVTDIDAEKSHLIHQATDQIRVMAEVLRTSAQRHDTVCLHSLVLAMSPRLIELADAISYAEINVADDVDPIEDLRAVVFGRVMADAGEEA
jgi:hypothetical protein